MAILAAILDISKCYTVAKCHHLQILSRDIVETESTAKNSLTNKKRFSSKVLLDYLTSQVAGAPNLFLFVKEFFAVDSVSRMPLDKIWRWWPLATV